MEYTISELIFYTDHEVWVDKTIVVESVLDDTKNGIKKVR